MKLFLLLFVVAFVSCKTPGGQSGSSLADQAGGSTLQIPDEPDEFPHIDFRRAKKVDILGIPFGDTVLNEFLYDRNLGVNNVWLQDDFILRFAHLAEQHGRDLEAAGFESCFDFGIPRDTSDYVQKQSGPKLFNVTALPRLTKDLYRARKCFLQTIRFPESVEWRTNRTPAEKKPPRTVMLFMPNVLTVHLDTTGTWPFGRRPNDDMIGRFNGLFLKMGREPGDCSGNQDIEALTRQGEEPDASGLSDSELCSLHSLSVPSQGTHVAGIKGWKSDGPMVPLNPPHKIKLANGEVKEGFSEETFPFLEPPNQGAGYYQNVPDSTEFHGWNYLKVKAGAKKYAAAKYSAEDPRLRSHPFCKNEGNLIRRDWQESTKARSDCVKEGKLRHGHDGSRVNLREGLPYNQRSSWAFYKTCEGVYRALCQGVDIDRITF